MPSTRKPASPKRLAANRANAHHSTGPKTSEGKARSARNSVKHGFTASSFGVVRLEDLQEIAHLKSDLVSAYQPANSQELLALERMALSQQAILRAARLESGLFTACLNETLSISNDEPFLPMNEALSGDGDIEVTRAQNRNYLLAAGFLRLSTQSNAWSLFLRYQAQAERQYRRALEDFDRLKALRNDLPVQDLPNHDLPNEPIPPSQPQPPSTTYTVSQTNPSPPPNPPSPAPLTAATPASSPCPRPRPHTHPAPLAAAPRPHTHPAPLAAVPRPHAHPAPLARLPRPHVHPAPLAAVLHSHRDQPRKKHLATPIRPTPKPDRFRSLGGLAPLRAIRFAPPSAAPIQCRPSTCARISNNPLCI